ncbi:hypothetical protein [Rhizobium rhizogenes]|jgi:hypothetical protein|uniref:hypothetical protein n=1 Tax=Rhizobium rhizogenes TaxID=359 RepID=UPI0015744111|nr:hypothetical protein [Rhizobium rhizogenes]NTI33092.1 hypothetical protein [Rhizobium rhizogenes]WEO64802.1 hypothetical protein G6L54_017410 [Rhizobium rhizogenes]
MQRRNILKAAVALATIPVVTTPTQSFALPASGAPSLAFLAVIQRYEIAYNAWLASDAQEEQDCVGPMFQTFKAAKNELFDFPCRTPTDVAAKIRYVFLQENRQAQGAYEGIANCEWNLAPFLNSLLGNDPIPRQEVANEVWEPEPQPQPETLYRSWNDIPDQHRTDELRQAELEMNKAFEGALRQIMRHDA